MNKNSQALEQLTANQSISNSNSSEQVTGSPTKSHWKKDSEASHCEYIGCLTGFGLFERRHHCRKCGNLFCSTHCSNYFRLDQYAQFHLKGSLSRGCDSCATDFIQWQKNLTTNTSKTSILKRHPGIMTTQQLLLRDNDAELDKDATSKPSKNIDIQQQKDQATLNTNNPIPSVPADWQWSTF